MAGLNGNGPPKWVRSSAAAAIFVSGLAAFWYEVTETKFDRPYLLAVILAMLGLVAPDRLIQLLRSIFGRGNGE